METLFLIGKKSFLVNTSSGKGKKFHCQYGEIDISKAVVGKTIKSSKGEKFLVVEPTITDMLKNCKRGPQVVLPKDAAQIVATCGVSSGWHCVDAGGGSGFLSIFLGNIVKFDGSVTSYEKNKEYIRNIQHNIQLCGLNNIVKIKYGDVAKLKERNLDLITLDMKGSEKIVKKAHKALKPGGWLCVLSPHIEQQKAVVNEMHSVKFVHAKTVETIQREWQVSDWTHPRPTQVVHTLFLTFGRKVN